VSCASAAASASATYASATPLVALPAVPPIMLPADALADALDDPSYSTLSAT
tara:strand:- start:710 stop:865 length:156 start_codon:yes stop_codon:yes gene_type:complete